MTVPPGFLCDNLILGGELHRLDTSKSVYMSGAVFLQLHEKSWTKPFVALKKCVQHQYKSPEVI